MSKRDFPGFSNDLIAFLLELRAKNTKIFRIHRALRFSQDKTPYDTHRHISFTPVDGPPTAWFFGLDPESLTVGAGEMGFDKARLSSLRDAVAGEAGAALSKSVAKLCKQGCRMGEPESKRVPSGFDADHPRADLLRRKSLATPSIWLGRRSRRVSQLSKDVIARFRKLRPVFDGLRAL